jgi:hypothetical protein
MTTAALPTRAEQFYGKRPILQAPPAAEPWTKRVASAVESEFPTQRIGNPAILAKLMGMAPCSCRECGHLRGIGPREKWTFKTSYCTGFFQTVDLDELHSCVFSRAVQFDQYGREVA